MLSDLLHISPQKPKAVTPFPDIDHSAPTIYNPHSRRDKLLASTALFKTPKLFKQVILPESRPTTSNTLIVLSSQPSRPQTSKTLISRPTTIGSSFAQVPLARKRYRKHDNPSSPPATSMLVDMKELYPLQPLITPQSADAAPACHHPWKFESPAKIRSLPKLVPFIPSPSFNRLDPSKTLDPPPSILAQDTIAIPEITAQYVTFLHGQAQLSIELEEMLNRIIGEWVIIQYVIKNIETVLKRFQIPWVEIGCFQLAGLVSDPGWRGRITRNEVMHLISNKEAQNKLRIAIIKVDYSENIHVRRRAVKIIAAILKGLVRRRKHEEFMKLVRAGRVIYRYWQMICCKRRFQLMFKASQLMHFEKARNLESSLRLNWNWKYEKLPKVVIHLASDTLQKASADNNIWQDLQVGRFLDLRDETVTVIYIARSYNDTETLLLNSLIDNCFDSRKRLYIMVPKTATIFPAGTSLAKMLYCCNKTMKDIRGLVCSKAAFIIPGIIGDYDIRISSILSIPIYGPITSLKNFYENPAKEREFLAQSNLGIPFGACLIPSSRSIIESRITELISSYPHIQIWTVRLNGNAKKTYRFNKCTPINGEIYNELASNGGVVQANPPGRYRTITVNFKMSPAMQWKITGSADLLTCPKAQLSVAHLVPQQTLSGQAILEITSSIAESMKKIELYSSFCELTVQVFHCKNGQRRAWVTNFSPYPTRTSSIVGYVMLAFCGTVCEEGGFLYDRCKSRRLNLRYINNIPHANLDPLYDHSETNDIYHKANPTDKEHRVALWVNGLDHSGWSNVSFAVINALMINSGVNFEPKWKLGTILPIFDEKVSLVTVGKRASDVIETILYCLMVINHRIGEVWTTSNFMDYAAALAAELQMQRDRKDVNHEPEKRLSVYWEKDETLNFDETDIGYYQDEALGIYECEEDGSEDDSLPNEMKDDVLQAKDSLNDLEKFLSQYTSIPDYNSLKLSWKSLENDNFYMASLLTTYQLTNRSIPSYQLREMADFGEEDVNDYMHVVPNRQRVVTGLGLEAYMEIMDFYVDSQIKQEVYELKQKSEKEVLDFKDLEKIKYKLVLRELAARNNDMKFVDKFDDKLLSALPKSSFVDPFENLVEKIGLEVDNAGLTDEIPVDEWTIKEEEEEEVDEEMFYHISAKQKARNVIGALF